MKIYGISGLGAESKIFDRTNEYLDTPIEFVPWVPHSPEDTLGDYAQRMLDSMDLSEPFCLVGLSLGGMIVTEMIKHVRPVRTVLISSASCRAELPALYRKAGDLKLIDLVPDIVLPPSAMLISTVLQWSNPKYKDMDHRELDADFLSWAKWATSAITKWDNDHIDPEVIRVHGEKDLILPNCMKVDYMVKNGSHLIVTEKAEEVATYLNTVFRLSDEPVA